MQQLFIESLYTNLRDNVEHRTCAANGHSKDVGSGMARGIDGFCPDNLWGPLNMLRGYTRTWYERTAIATAELEPGIGSANPGMGIY